MTNKAMSDFSTKRTPQNTKAKSGQVENNEGGYVFRVTPETRLRRFLILGSDATFYKSAKEMTTESAQVVLDFCESDHKHLVDTIVEISEGGLAAKNDPALFALALAASNGTDAERAYALDSLSRVARTGTHLFTFLAFVNNFRGWGPALRKRVSNWYLEKDASALAYQSLKYKSRNGYSHRDVLRLAHPVTQDPSMRAMFDYITHKIESDDLPDLVRGYLAAQEEDADIPALITEYNLSWEMLPTQALNDPAVWTALIDAKMPLGALLRQLPRLTYLGVFDDSKITTKVVNRLKSTTQLRKARIHPLQMLNALKTYSEGKSFRGNSTWTPNRRIVDALDAGFYASFDCVAQSDERTLIALDVSPSMRDTFMDSPLNCAEASVALAVMQMTVNEDSDVVAFTGGDSWYQRRSKTLTELTLSPRQRLDDAMKSLPTNWGYTDCALPMTWALAEKRKYDTIIIFTDNDTGMGDIHPYQALLEYRRKMKLKTRLIVVGMTATNFTIADPSDAGMLDVVGFDLTTPNTIAEFSNGNI